jgi:predicted nucleic acid-binding protein
VIVLDASATLELLLGKPRGARVGDRALVPSETLHVPDLLDLEVAQVLRRWVASGQVGPGRARQALDDLALLDLGRWPHHALLERVWQLRSNLTAHDAAYVALAEALPAPLLMCNRRLSAAPGNRARVEQIA